MGRPQYLFRSIFLEFEMEGIADKEDDGGLRTTDGHGLALVCSKPNHNGILVSCFQSSRREGFSRSPSCVLVRGEMDVDRSLLQDGRRVIVRGEVTVYEARGQYQLRALAVELEGL